MIDLVTWASHLPAILSARWEGHWAEVAVGGVLLIYAFVSVFTGSIWSGGNVNSDDKPLSFWGAIAGYATAGFALTLYV